MSKDRVMGLILHIAMESVWKKIFGFGLTNKVRLIKALSFKPPWICSSMYSPNCM